MCRMFDERDGRLSLHYNRQSFSPNLQRLPFGPIPMRYCLRVALMLLLPACAAAQETLARGPRPGQSRRRSADPAVDRRRRRAVRSVSAGAAARLAPDRAANPHLDGIWKRVPRFTRSAPPAARAPSSPFTRRRHRCCRRVVRSRAGVTSCSGRTRRVAARRCSSSAMTSARAASRS